MNINGPYYSNNIIDIDTDIDTNINMNMNINININSKGASCAPLATGRLCTWTLVH